MIHKPKQETYDISFKRHSSESHLRWKDLFHKIPLYFRSIAVFETDNESDNSTIGNKTTKIYRQNPLLNGYHRMPELDKFKKVVTMNLL